MPIALIFWHLAIPSVVLQCLFKLWIWDKKQPDLGTCALQTIKYLVILNLDYQYILYLLKKGSRFWDIPYITVINYLWDSRLI